MLAADGAALGLGSDVGGSIRIPSGYCGIFGLKPGQARVPYAGVVGESIVHRRDVGSSRGRSCAVAVVIPPFRLVFLLVERR